VIAIEFVVCNLHLDIKPSNFIRLCSELSEFGLNSIGQLIKLLGDFLFWQSWVDELHLFDIRDDILLESLLNVSHCDFLL